MVLEAGSRSAIRLRGGGGCEALPSEERSNNAIAKARAIIGAYYGREVRQQSSPTLMGQIRKRGEIYWIRYYRAGKRHEESTRSTRRGDAERLLKLREGDVAKGIPISPAIVRFTFDDAATDL